MLVLIISGDRTKSSSTDLINHTGATVAPFKWNLITASATPKLVLTGYRIKSIVA